MNMTNFLLDRDFLIQLSKEHNQEKYARICIFDKKKMPLEYLVGYVTGGSINIDGDSVLRRTCSLSIVTEHDSPLTEAYWALSHEFRLEIGIKNRINPLYDDIVWFPMGHFLISNFNITHGPNNSNISISGQDLGAKLNGTNGGSLSSEVNFGVIENEQTDGTIIIEQVEIETIIRQSLQQYALEPLENIIINDLPEHGLELLEYKGSNPMFMVIEKPVNNDNKQVNIINCTLDGSSQIYYLKDGGLVETTINEVPQYWSLAVQDGGYNNNAYEVLLKKPSNITELDTEKKYCIVKIECGNTIGYRKTPLVYAGDLILKAGSNIAGLLDSIKKMLGEFEYFYNTDGRFVFQKKHTYTQELFSPSTTTGIEPIATSSPYVYDFSDYDLFTNISKAPQIQNVKNDFTVWGTKKSVNNNSINIHARYAIDQKPQKYCSPWWRYEKLTNLVIAYRCIKIDNNYYLDTRTGLVHLQTTLPKEVYTLGDILQECSYSTLAHGDTFYLLTTERLPGQPDLQFYNELDATNIEYIYQENAEQEYSRVRIDDDVTLYIKGEDGETYTALADNTPLSNYTAIYQYIGGGITYLSNDYDGEEPIDFMRCDWRELIYQMAYDYNRHSEESDFYHQIYDKNPHCPNGITGYEQYYIELLGFWRTLYNPADKLNCFGTEDRGPAYWNRNVYLQPETMIFWFDFLDTGDTEIDKYSVKKIGIRPKVESKAQTKTTIFQTNTPEVLFVQPDSTNNEQDYEILQAPSSIERLISVSAQGRSLIEQVNDLFYTYAYCSEGVTLSSIPMLWLEPNTRIRVKDIGDLTVSKISFGLEPGSTMSLTCTKVINPIAY